VTIMVRPLARDSLSTSPFGQVIRTASTRAARPSANNSGTRA
jgi:hypothetical protein